MENELSNDLKAWCVERRVSMLVTGNTKRKRAHGRQRAAVIGMEAQGKRWKHNDDDKARERSLVQCEEKV